MSRSEESLKKISFMSIENMKKIIHFHQVSGMPFISLLGGEPTLHPEFSKIIDLCIEAGLSIRLFTGGVVPMKAKRRLQSLTKSQLSIITNISAREHCKSDSEYKVIVQTLKDLAELSTIGYTLFNTDVDPSFLCDLVNESGCLHHIRLGLAMPGPTDSTYLLPPQKYPEAGKWILRLARLCDKNDITVGFDCGFTMCMFTPSELGELAYLGCVTRFLCNPIIDIGPDLDIWSCFATSNLDRTSFSEHSDRQSMVNYFTEKQKAYRHFGVYDSCHTCKHKCRGVCSGGCLSQVIRSFSSPNNMTKNT